MANYELTLVLPEKATAAKLKSLETKIEELAKTLKGKVKKLEDWGKIELSYPIKKSKSGSFLHFELELESEAAKNLNDKLRMENDIVRYLLIKKNG